MKMNGADLNVVKRSVTSDYRFKLVLVGSFGVGKSSLMFRHFNQTFKDDPQTTIGVDFRQKKFILDKVSVILEVWDTAGQEKYANIVQVYYRGAHAAVAVYDVMRMNTFDRAKVYLEDIMGQSIPPLVMALVGNKSDLTESGTREVKMEDAIAYAEKNQLIYMETSAKTAENVDEMFELISNKLVEETQKRRETRIMMQYYTEKQKNKTDNRRCCF